GPGRTRSTFPRADPLRHPGPGRVRRVRRAGLVLRGAPDLSAARRPASAIAARGVHPASGGRHPFGGARPQPGCAVHGPVQPRQRREHLAQPGFLPRDGGRGVQRAGVRLQRLRPEHRPPVGARRVRRHRRRVRPSHAQRRRAAGADHRARPLAGRRRGGGPRQQAAGRRTGAGKHVHHHPRRGQRLSAGALRPVPHLEQAAEGTRARAGDPRHRGRGDRVRPRPAPVPARPLSQAALLGAGRGAQRPAVGGGRGVLARAHGLCRQPAGGGEAV
ncbi:MAG: hypothetical protein AVDCRST_MAG89-2691, partial [uncultured Gemmatimonadetes bacterium]